MTREQIELWLMANCTMLPPEGCAPDTGLKNIYMSIFREGRHQVSKAVCAAALAEWYSDRQNIIEIWNGAKNALLPLPGLGEIEKEFISVYVQYEGREFVPTTKAIAEKHGITPPGENRYHINRDFYDTTGYEQKYLRFLHLIKKEFPRSKAVYLFPGGRTMPFFVRSVLKEIIPPMRYVYEAFTPAKGDYLICRESRVADFAAMVRFAGSEQLKVKEGTFDITKSKLAKMVEVIGFEEVCDDNGRFSTPKEVKRIHNFKVALPLLLLAANAGLIQAGRDLMLRPGDKAVRLLEKPLHEVAKALFLAYMKSERIYETHYLTYLSVSDGESFLPWAAIRAPVIELLKTCPVGQFVRYDTFEKYVWIFRGDFFRNQTHGTVYVRGYASGYYGGYVPEWSECEAQIVRLILSFCGALGMLDIAYKERVRGFLCERNDYRVGISGFRITPLGAWILGLESTYDAPAEVERTTEGELIVQPDHTVLISGLKKRVEHESYLSKFLTKASIDDNVAIYKLDFAGMVRAFDQRITPKQIKSYLGKVSDRPVPGNVIRSLDDWQAKVGRVRIRNVTILEADDALLLQELLHLKGMEKHSSEVLEHAFVIDGDERKKVKLLAERNGWLVKMDT